MVRAAVLASGDGSRLQAILDAVYFNEIPNFELVAVICPQQGCYAMTRALSAGIPAFMDIELVILAGYDCPLGVVPYQFRNRIIGTYPALYPAFSEEDGDPVELALETGLKVTGATSFFSDGDGRVRAVIMQRSIEVNPDDTVQSLSARLMEECEWPLLNESVSLFCAGRLSVRGRRVDIIPLPGEEESE